LTLIQSTRLKAVSCREGTASLVVTQTFQVLPGPVVLLSFKISGSVSAAGLSDDMKVAFVDALVEMLGLPSRDLVKDIAVKDARRRLLAVDLSLGILTNSDDSADSLQNTAKSTNFGTLTQRAGWSDATVSGVEVSVLKPGGGGGGGGTPATTPAPADTRWPVMVAGVLGAVAGLTLMATGSFYLFRRGREKNALAEKQIQAVSDSALHPADVQPSVLDTNTSTKKHFDYEDMPSPEPPEQR
jgi:hypothetical protein